MKYFESLIDAIGHYQQQGYIENFNLTQDHLECIKHKFKINHAEFKIDEFYRFEDDSSADQQSIIYAISSDKYGLKGTLIDGYSIYSEPISDQMLRKLQMRHSN